jgi:hypothetical protein
MPLERFEVLIRLLLANGAALGVPEVSDDGQANAQAPPAVGVVDLAASGRWNVRPLASSRRGSSLLKCTVATPVALGALPGAAEPMYTGMPADSALDVGLAQADEIVRLGQPFAAAIHERSMVSDGASGQPRETTPADLFSQLAPGARVLSISTGPPGQSLLYR